MDCQKCKGLGSYVRADCKSGQFIVIDCSCRFTANVYFCNDTGVTLEVTEVVSGIMSVLENYNGKKSRRLINASLFQQDIEEGIITLHPQESH